MAKQPKNNLTEILKQSEGDLHTPEATEPEPVVKNENPNKRPACREGTKVIMGHFPEEVHTQMQYLRIETKKSGQDLLADALNLLFAKHDKPPIA